MAWMARNIERRTDPGEFNIAHNITCDADGWVYVADRENHRVQVFDGNGKYETQWNNLHRPCGLFMPPGKCPVCYIGELGADVVRIGCSPDGKNINEGFGATAPQAAGVIHTDFEKGFIRAEVIAYEDFVGCGGEQGAEADDAQDGDERCNESSHHRSGHHRSGQARRPEQGLEVAVQRGRRRDAQPVVEAEHRRLGTAGQVQVHLRGPRMRGQHVLELLDERRDAAIGRHRQPHRPHP